MLQTLILLHFMCDFNCENYGPNSPKTYTHAQFHALSSPTRGLLKGADSLIHQANFMLLKGN